MINLDKKAICKMSYTELYHLVLLVDKFLDYMRRNGDVNYLPPEERKRYNNLMDLRVEIMSYIAGKINKLGGFGNGEN